MKPLESQPAAYIGVVLALYVDLPDTPMRYSLADLALARKLHQEGCQRFLEMSPSCVH